MKILQIVHSYPPQTYGGTELYTQSLTEVLAKNHQVMIIYSQDSTIAKEIYCEKANIKNVLIKSVARIQATSFLSTYYNPSADLEIVNLVRDFSPDVVHIEHLLNHSVSIIDELSALLIPMIFTLHDYWYICPQCFLAKSNGTLCEGPKNGENCLSCENADGNRYVPFANVISSNSTIVMLLNFLKKITFPRMRRYITFIFNKIIRRYDIQFKEFTETKERLRKMVYVLNKAAQIISPSKLLAERYKNEGINNIIVIPHGIRNIPDRDYADDKYKNMKDKKVTFAYIGSIARHKGIHILVEAFNDLASMDAELLIYGGLGQNIHYEKELAELIKNPSVRFMGFIEHKKIYELLKNIDVVVIPSICAENFPLIANESFLAKTPIIASNVGGLNELIKNGVSGFIFQQGNVRQLSDILKKIMNSPEILLTFSKNIPPIKTMEIHAQEVESLYQHVISNNALYKKQNIYL